jgi:glyceraldehyde 3-phosphate dehydrogenase
MVPDFGAYWRFGWYDNEWGYTCRLADLAALVGGQL